MTTRLIAAQLPKVELHVHLEGSIRPRTLMELARRNQVKLPTNDLQEFYRFKDFDHFIDVYFTITGCLRTPDDYRLIAYEFGSDCARQNIRYAEATFTITTNMQYSGLPWQDILDGLNAGRQQAKEEYGVDWRWIFDINRNRPETQDQVLEIALEATMLPYSGVVALGLGGSEAEFPAYLFKNTFQRALEAGLHRVPHSGETAGPESIWASLQDLHSERIGHGVRCVEDERLIEYLRERQIALEVCPTSNVRLGIYSDYAHHPLRRLWDAGLNITINSDDPPMFNTDLNQEYEIAVEQFSFSLAELQKASLNALLASFIPQADKLALEQDFLTEFHRLQGA